MRRHDLRLKEEATAVAQATAVVSGEKSGTRKALLLHDGLSFLLLLLVSAVLFGVTLFLFRSFESHRDDLAKRWSSRGAAALARGKPGEAIVPLRAAISYAPDDAKYQLLLAEALAASGKTEEATNYFLNLWEARPADSVINLQLARLARQRGDVSQAAEYYRAAIFGVWPDHALEQRRAVRYELADYLAQQGDKAGARAELLTAVAAAPDTEELDLELGRHLQSLGALPDALGMYRKAVAHAPRDGAALAAMGSAAYAMGDYGTAARLLRRARETKAHAGVNVDGLEAMAQDADRMVDLSLSRDLPARTRAEHLLLAGKIAEARLETCAAGGAPSSDATARAGQTAAVVAANGQKAAAATMATAPAGSAGAASGDTLEGLRAQWKASEARPAREALLTDAAAQDGMEELIFATEQQTAARCGAPTGDDARLLKMAQAAQAAGQP